MGAITPLGLNVEEFWNGLKEGRHGFGEITRFDASEYKAHLAGEVKGFVGKEFMDAKAAKRMELFCQYAVAATKEAIERQVLTWRKKMLTVWAVRLVQESEAFRQWSVNTPDY